MNKSTSYYRGFAEGAAKKTSDNPGAGHTEINTFLYIKEENEKNKARERQIQREAKLRTFAGWAFLAGLCWGLSPYFFHIAAAARQSNAIGGEIVIPLIPFFCFMLHRAERKNNAKK